MPSPRLSCLALAALMAMPFAAAAQVADKPEVAAPVMAPAPAPVPAPVPAPAMVPAAAAQPVFSVDAALFVIDRAEGYGMYQARANNHFKSSETLRFYLEPIGYQYKMMGDLYSFGATVDLRLTQGGNTVFSKDGFLNANFLSHHPNKEINFTGSLDVTGAPAGEYSLELVMQDKSGPGVARVVLPFVID